MSNICRLITIMRFLAVITLFGSMGACAESSSSNGYGTLVSGCLSQTNLDRSTCECVAKKAETDLTPGGYSLLVAMLSGDEEKSKELSGSLKVAESMQAGMFMTSAPARCAAGARENSE